MSSLFYSFSCTSCHLDRGFCFDTEYDFVDSEGDGYVPSLEASWCEDCDNVVISANPQTPASIADEVKLRSEWITEERSQKRSLLHPFRKQNDGCIQRWEAEIARLKLSADFFRYKNIVPRCLTCNGKNVIPITLLDQNSFYLGISHHCGGEVLASCEGSISFGQRPIIKYNNDGTIFNAEQKDFSTYDLSQESLSAILALGSHVSLKILEAARLTEDTESAVHTGFSMLGIYLAAREYLAISERRGDPIAISMTMLTNHPYLDIPENSEIISDKEKFFIKKFILLHLLQYDREANRAFGRGPALWSSSKESQKFGLQAAHILGERIRLPPEMKSFAFGCSIEELAREIAQQPENLSTAFGNLISAGKLS